MFGKYPKIKRIDDEEVKSILHEKGLIVSEKIDGCCLQVYKHEGVICGGKRSCQIQVLGEDSQGQGGQFAEFCKWIQATNWDWLPKHIKLFGEGIKGKKCGNDLYKYVGKIKYKNQEPFILFDMFNMKDQTWISPKSKSKEWHNLLEEFKKSNKYNLPVVPILDYDYTYTNLEDLKKFLGKSQFSDNVEMEGIVLKKFYEDGKVLMAKYVTDEFKEFMKHKKSPKGSKFEELTSSVVTKARVAKLMKSEGLTDIKQMGRLIGLVSKDVFEEEEPYLKEEAYKIFKKQMGKEMPRLIRKYFTEIRVKNGEENGEENKHT